MKGRFRLTNIRDLGNNTIECDFETLDDTAQEIPVHRDLSPGYNTDVAVATRMFIECMGRHHMDAIAVQNHCQAMVDVLKADYPGLEVYAHPRSDALVWPGFGSCDVTIDSGRGGFYFRPDGASPWLPPGSR